MLLLKSYIITNLSKQIKLNNQFSALNAILDAEIMHKNLSELSKPKQARCCHIATSTIINGIIYLLG